MNEPMEYEVLEHRPILQYRLCTQRRTNELNLAVNDLISQGWEPFGSPIVVGGEDCTTIYGQAMVRYEDDSAPERPARTPIETKNRPAVGS